MPIIYNLFNLFCETKTKQLDKYDIYLDLIEKGLYDINNDDNNDFIEVKIPKKYILKTIFINM